MCGESVARVPGRTLGEVVWPLPPETARITYIGQVASEKDVGRQSSFLDRLKRGLLGSQERGLLAKRPFDTYVDEIGRVFVSNGTIGALLVLDGVNHEAHAAATRLTHL